MSSDYVTVFGFDESFLTVIALILSAFVSIHICFGRNNRRSREYSVMLVLILMVSTQYYFLGNVATYIPSSRFFVYNSEFSRPSCHESSKGGKRPLDSIEHYDINPCYCNEEAGVCKDKITDEIITGTCPTNSTAICVNSLGTEIPLYLDMKRDCIGGQGRVCSKLQPCHPCDLQSIMAFGAPRCRTCSSDYQGDCNFIPDVGPYCLDSPGSKKVVPCTRCCTEPQVVIVNGTCY